MRVASSMAETHSYKNMVGSVVTLLGSIALISGVFLSWMKYPSFFGSILISGWSFDRTYSGVVLAVGIVCGVAGLINIIAARGLGPTRLGFVSNSLRANIALGGGLAATVVMIFRAIYITDAQSQVPDMIWVFGDGFWLCFSAAPVLLVSGLLNRN